MQLWTQVLERKTAVFDNDLGTLIGLQPVGV